MAENTVTSKRGGKGYSFTEGLTDTGKSRVFILDAELHPVHQQQVRRAPIFFGVVLDEGEMNGEVTDMYTTWKTALVSNGGKPIHATGITETMRSSAAHRDEFVGMFKDALKFIINGYVQADLAGNKTGYNGKPVFVPAPVYDEDGVTIIGYKLVPNVLTPEQENEPADDTYYNPPAAS